MKTIETKLSEMYALSIHEAAVYFRIGETKLRNMIRENRDAPYLMWNGSRARIKRSAFEKYLDTCNTI